MAPLIDSQPAYDGAAVCRLCVLIRLTMDSLGEYPPTQTKNRAAGWRRARSPFFRDAIATSVSARQSFN